MTGNEPFISFHESMNKGRVMCPVFAVVYLTKVETPAVSVAHITLKIFQPGSRCGPRRLYYIFAFDLFSLSSV